MFRVMILPILNGSDNGSILLYTNFLTKYAYYIKVNYVIIFDN
jgi:hypothetical protein